MKLSLNKAATTCGKAKGTLLKAIRDGDMSAPKNKSGQYEIDSSELNRVFPYQVSDQSRKPMLTPENHHQINTLKSVLDAKEMIEVELRNQIADLKEQRDKWQEQARTLLISNQRTPTEPENPPRGGLFGFFRREG